MALTLRAPLILGGSVTGGTPNLRGPLVLTESVTGGTPNVRAPLTLAEPVTGGNPNLRAALIVVQAVIPVAVEIEPVTEVFPTLPGLTWSVKKNPEFNSVLRQNISGKEVATAFMQYPWWHFELIYEYLPDLVPGSSGYTDLRTIQGLFLQMQGSYGLFLFQDPDDYTVTGGAIATADGVTLQWPFFRDFGGFLEPVGQIDLRSSYYVYTTSGPVAVTLPSFASSAVNTGTSAINVANHGLTTGQGPLFIANTGGTLPGGLAANTPYWAISVDANHFQLASTKANALANTPITLTTTGSGNDALSKGYAIYDNGTIVNPGSASLTLPNQIVFGSAPTTGHAITADFDYFFACRFEENVTEFEKFSYKWWQLGKLNFKSVIL